jgi:hypothetical protein
VNQKEKIAVVVISLLGISALTLFTIYFVGKNKKQKTTSTSTGMGDSQKKTVVASYQDAENSGLIGDILYKVISREGKSKDYSDLIALDGGTVGIAHFAVGGLAELYQHMDTMKYFGKTREDMIANYSSKCRPSGKTGNDTGWGCYSKGWWLEGFKKFLASPDSKKIQDKAWSLKMESVIKNALSKGWNSPRQIAIALGVANSRGGGGFSKLASANNWDAEKTINAYVKDDHTKRRKEAIDKFFPIA